MNELGYIEEKFPSYQIIELLSASPISNVFLAEHSDKLYVIKEWSKDFCYLENPAIFDELDCPGLPKIVDFCESDESFFYSYEYINGVNLKEAYESGLITTPAAVAIAEKLCGIISYLHEKSVLHWDIKPDNVLMSGDDVFFIDYGIAQNNNKKVGDNKALSVTESFVSPEPGYKNADFRTDIYAIGMVLYYLLTGGTDIKGLAEKVSDRPLREIINRCTNSEVKIRYKTFKKLRSALQKHKKGTAYQPLVLVVLAASFVLCFIAGALIFSDKSESKNADLDAAAVAGNVEALSTVESESIDADQPLIHQFADPIIEQAIRLNLGKTADEPVYSYELLGVEYIFIVGDRVFGNWEEIENYRTSIMESGKAPLYTMFLSTTDIVACKNLKHLVIQYNAIDNIDFLAENHSLQDLELMNTSITDIAVFKELRNLVNLRLTNSPISDISPIKNCQMLSNFHLIECPVSDLSPLKDCTMLDMVILFQINAANYDFTISDKHYSDISIGYANYEAFMPYLSGITVKNLSIIECRIRSLDVFPDMTVTETLEINQNDPVNTDGSERILADGAKIVE
jgi:serine/threonine protein kinase